MVPARWQYFSGLWQCLPGYSLYSSRCPVYGGFSSIAKIHGSGSEWVEMRVAIIYIMPSDSLAICCTPIHVIGLCWFRNFSFERNPSGKCFHGVQQWSHWTGSWNCHLNPLYFLCQWINKQWRGLLCCLRWLILIIMGKLKFLHNRAKNGIWNARDPLGHLS